MSTGAASATILRVGANAASAAAIPVVSVTTRNTGSDSPPGAGPSSQAPATNTPGREDGEPARQVGLALLQSIRTRSSVPSVPSITSIGRKTKTPIR